MPVKNFRSRFYNIKNEVLGSQVSPKSLVGDEAVDVDLNLRCTADDAEGNRGSEGGEECFSEEESENDDTVTVGVELPAEDRVFKPLFLAADWIDSEKNKCVSVAIVLPSGVGRGFRSVRVVDDGDYVELKVQWPSELANINTLHQKWLKSRYPTEKMDTDHPKIIAYEKVLMAYRKRINEVVESVVRIPLPLKVQPHIQKTSNLSWPDSTVRIIYIDLKAVAETYAQANDTEEFEVVR